MVRRLPLGLGSRRGFEKQAFTIDSNTSPKRLSVKQAGGTEYNFCFDFEENGHLLWVEMAGDKALYPKAVEPGKDAYYSESKKVEK